MKDLLKHLLPSAALLALVAGCGEGPPGAGLTNGPPPAGNEKAGDRTDLPSAVIPNEGETLGKTGDQETNAGVGGRGGGNAGARPEFPKDADATGKAPADAQGTKPADKPDAGDTKAPQ